MYNNVVINAVFYLSLKTNADDSAGEWYQIQLRHAKFFWKLSDF